jgi:tRNA nucleotidyltransferase/poly(A) polymerase
MRLSQPPAQIGRLMNIFERKGYVCLVVGGAVRDLILRREPKDYDLATNATPQQIEEVIGSDAKGYRVVKGPQAERALEALTSLILCPDGEVVEITTFRADLGYEEGNRAKVVAVPAKTFEQDASRRDLTINAMGMTKDGEVIDPTKDGVKDLKAGIIRTVGNPNERFAEDPLRIIRAVRFAVKYDFRLLKSVEKAIKKNLLLLDDLSQKRKRDEIEQVLYYPDGFKKLMELGILPHLMPEMRNLRSYRHNPEYHPEGDVYDHYIAAFDCHTSHPRRTELGGWAILFHDIGKPASAELKEGNDYHSFHQHDRIGADIILNKYNNQTGPFEFSKKELNGLAWTTRNHLSSFWDMKKPVKVADMANNEYYPWLINVAYADTCMRPKGKRFDERRQFITDIQNEVNIRKEKVGKRPQGFAVRVFQELDIPAGRERGEIMQKIEELVASGAAKDYEAALQQLKSSRK